jgi:MarR family transcriptional regulator, 2-MHQ and catechol-resistance regulon repressor
VSGKGEKKRKRALEAYGRLQRAAARSALRVDDALQEHGLSSSQYGVLSALATDGSTHQQELASALGRSKAQMTAIIDMLEHRALVRRERQSEDKRFITVHLTDAGRALHAAASPSRDDAIVELMSDLSGAQRARLARLCRRLLRTLEPQRVSVEQQDNTQPVSVPLEVAAIAGNN